MLRRTPRMAICLLAACACDGTSSGGEAPGRLTLARKGEVLVDAPASASRCPADSTIALVAIGTEWVAAISVRVAWPSDTARDLTVVRAPGRPGTGVVAARPVADSAGSVLLAARGSIELGPGATMSGRFEVVAPTQPGAPDSVLLTGRFESVLVADDLCPQDSPRIRATVLPN